jgi:hypothetical protein
MKSSSKRVTNLLAWGGLTGFAVLLLTDHAVHVWQVLPFLFLMACPLLHVFHHGGHASHNGEVTDTAHEMPPLRGAANHDPGRTLERTP